MQTAWLKSFLAFIFWMGMSVAFLYVFITSSDIYSRLLSIFLIIFSVLSLVHPFMQIHQLTLTFLGWLIICIISVFSFIRQSYFAGWLFAFILLYVLYEHKKEERILKDAKIDIIIDDIKENQDEI